MLAPEKGVQALPNNSPPAPRPEWPTLRQRSCGDITTTIRPPKQQDKIMTPAQRETSRHVVTKAKAAKDESTQQSCSQAPERAAGKQAPSLGLHQAQGHFAEDAEERGAPIQALLSSYLEG